MYLAEAILRVLFNPDIFKLLVLPSFSNHTHCFIEQIYYEPMSADKELTLL